MPFKWKRNLETGTVHDSPDLPYINAYSNDFESQEQSTFFLLQKFHKVLNSMFFKLGHFIGRHPSHFIAVPIFITLLGLTGFQQMSYVMDPEYLFSPSNGHGQEERRIVERLFPVNYSSHFSPQRLNRLSHFANLYVSSKANGSMFRVDVFNDLLLLDEAIRNLTMEWQDTTYYFSDICSQMNGECVNNDQVLGLAEFMPEIEEGTMLLNYPVSLFPLLTPFYLGGAIVNESEGVVLETKALSLYYWLRDDDWKQQERSYIFEEKILEFLETAEFEHINVARFVSRSLADELDNNAQAVIPFIFITVVLMIMFSVCIVFITDWVRSKLLVGICGLLAAAFASVCAFGFLMFCGVPFISLNLACPFLMLGIGIDDMFVILSAWHRTKIQDTVPTRLAETYREAAVSITITSLTNMLSFFIGTITPFPSVQIFCLYTGFAILFTYIWFITFFGGCLAVAGKLEQNQRHCVTFQKVLSKSESAHLGFSYNFWCSGGVNQADPFNPRDNRPHPVMIFFRDYVGRALNLPSVKALVIFLFFLYIGGAFYGCTKIQEGLDKKKMILDTSYLVEYFNSEDQLFRKYPSYSIQVIINENLTYSDPKTEAALLQLHDSFENLTCTGGRIFTQSWIRGFYNYLKRLPEMRNNITDDKSFIESLKSNYLGPWSSEYLDVKFNEGESQIVASRFIIQAYDIKDSTEDYSMMLALRKVAQESQFEVEVYNPYFVFFDQFVLVRSTCIQTITLAAAVMMVVSLIFIPNPFCSLWVAFSIVSIEIGVVGYMSLWGVNLDTISMVNLIMCVGFSVDFSAHISYAYLTARATTPAGKVEECLFNLGLPVLQGGISTIVGVLTLSIAPSYVYTTFFKTVFLVVIFGLMHGIFLLPVMLSLLGPGSFNRREGANSSIFKEIFVKVPTIAANKESEMSLDEGLGGGSSGISSHCNLEEMDSSEKSDNESLRSNNNSLRLHMKPKLIVLSDNLLSALVENNNEASNEASNDASKEASNEASNDASKEASNEASKEASNEASKEVFKEASNDASNDASNESSNDASNDASKEASNDSSKETANQSPNNSPNESPDESSVMTSVETTVDASTQTNLETPTGIHSVAFEENTGGARCYFVYTRDQSEIKDKICLEKDNVDDTCCTRL